MRATMEIDDRLMPDAMRASGRKTRRDVADAALRLLVQTKAQEAIRRLRGQLAWRGDVDGNRPDRITAYR